MPWQRENLVVLTVRKNILSLARSDSKQRWDWVWHSLQGWALISIWQCPPQLLVIAFTLEIEKKEKKPHAWGLNDLPKIKKPSWGQKKTGILIHDLHESYLPYLKCHIKINNIKETMSIIFFSFTLSDFHVLEISTKHVPVLEEKEVYS